MEDLKDVVTPGADTVPPVDPTDAQAPAGEDDKDLTDEELQARIATLQEEAKKEEDPVAKRHKQQEAGWHMKVAKEREKAKELEEANRKVQETASGMEKALMEDAFEKIQSNDHGLPYLEKLAETNPSLADKVSKQHWGKSAKELILDTKRKLAEEGDENAKKLVSEEDIRASERANVLHELSIQSVEAEFSGLSEAERKEAKEYFDDIAEGKRLTPDKAKKYAEMAKSYVLRWKKAEDPKPDPAAKARAEADKASGWLAWTPPGGNVDEARAALEGNRQALLNAGIPKYKVDLIYPLK